MPNYAYIMLKISPYVNKSNNRVLHVKRMRMKVKAKTVAFMSAYCPNPCLNLVISMKILSLFSEIYFMSKVLFAKKKCFDCAFG